MARHAVGVTAHAVMDGAILDLHLPANHQAITAEVQPGQTLIGTVSHMQMIAIWDYAEDIREMKVRAKKFPPTQEDPAMEVAAHAIAMGGAILDLHLPLPPPLPLRHNRLPPAITVAA